MGQVTGYICDVCDRFAVQRDEWLKISSYADKDAAHIDVCSADCLVRLGQERGGNVNKPKRNHASDERILAVLAEAEATTPRQAANKFGLSEGTVYRWIRRYGSDD